MNESNGKPRALVVGAGIAGIATAARLARRGWQVKVVEKNEKSGGRCGQMVIDGYRFDTGATLFLMPELYAETSAALGERMEDHLDLHRIDPTYQLVFQDDTQFHLTSNMHALMAQVEAVEPGAFERLLHYLGEGRRHYELALPNLINRGFYSLPEFINPRMLALFLRLKATTLHSAYAGRFFRTRKLQMAFTFQDMYMGLSPYQAPAVYSLMQATELTDGLYYPAGGMYTIAERLTGIAENLGVEFVYNAPVEQIQVEGKRASGVLLADGRALSAEVVVANADLGYVYRHLLPDDGTADRIDRKEYGCATVMFYWGLDRQYPQLAPHNLLFAGDYRRSFEDVFGKATMPTEPNFYMHAPARLDPTAAPPGCDSLYLAVPVGHMNEDAPQDWPAIQARARQYILRRLAGLGMADLESHIKVEVGLVPPDWKRRYNLTRGSAHGLSHRLTQMAYFRPANRHRCYHNLYFVGASTHPGTGVPTVLVSARLASERILAETGA
ncbi:MAG: phytoene desaturase [Anaerolineales bacterium]|nr:phytoene desaturase [Anaerolineales bacterium]